jgi:hypothetical protein
VAKAPADGKEPNSLPAAEDTGAAADGFAVEANGVVEEQREAEKTARE